MQFFFKVGSYIKFGHQWQPMQQQTKASATDEFHNLFTLIHVFIMNYKAMNNDGWWKEMDVDMQ